MKLCSWNVVNSRPDPVCVITREWSAVGGGSPCSDCYMMIIVSNKAGDQGPRTSHLLSPLSPLTSPPRSWARLARDGEVVSHRDGEVGALAPLARLSLWSGGPADGAGAHWQSDPFSGPSERVCCGARHPTVRGGAGHLPSSHLHHSPGKNIG